MLKSLALFVAALAAGTLLAACSAPSTNTTTNANANATANTSANTNANAPASTATNTSTGAAATGSLADPKSSIAYQFELVKAGDLDKLKACLTPRLRDGLTQEALDKAKANAAAYSIDDLYDSAEMGEADGKKTAKIKMKNGRTLTTLVETDGKWLADTVWFK
jgi:hypothetical protein